MPSSSPAQRGFSLVEVMVAIAIGLVLMLTVSTMVARQESMRRGVTSGNDLTGNSAYAAYMLDRELRSAGSGFSQNAAAYYGCPLAVSRDNTQILPATGAFPAPFSSVPLAAALAPLIVHAGAGANGSDVIAVATGNSALGESLLSVTPGSAAAGQVTLSHTIGMRPGDLVLLAQAAQRCMLQQVDAAFVPNTTPTLTLGGGYAANVIAGTALVNFGAPPPAGGNAQAVVLGNVVGNQPKLMLFGVREDNTLVSYDLLRLNSANVETLVEGVVDMRVLYGVDTGPAGVAQAARTVDSWVPPTGAFAANAVLASPAVIQSILAVRVALVLRSDLAERDNVTPATLQLFDGRAEQYTVPAGTENQRYRVVEFTVPLRNVRSSR